MQIGFSKNISENLDRWIVDPQLQKILLMTKKNWNYQDLEHFRYDTKKSRIGRNPKTKEQKTITR